MANHKPAPPDFVPAGLVVAVAAGADPTTGAPPGGGPPRRALAGALATVFVIAVLAALGGLGVRSTAGGEAAVDEPQYLLTARSIFDDRNLDIDDEIDAEMWRDYHDANLPVQTEVLADGRQISPHDPLLPIALAPAVGTWGLTGAKLAMAVLAGLTATATLWVAVRRLGIGLTLGTAGVGLAFASPPLSVYSQQVYPEVPAALAAVAAVGAVTGPLGAAGLTAFATAAVALPWLSVKYTPVAAALVLVAAIRLMRRRRWVATGVLGTVLATAGVMYLAVHQAVWGGWTVYASGDHFQSDGEFAVVGTDADYWGRSQRLAALLVDRDYGIAAWQPAWLLVLPALGALAARGRWRAGPLPALVVPAVAGWLVASFVALTMNGYWFPGRQLVVILPLVLLVILAWLQRAPDLVRGGAAVLAWLGVLAHVALLVDGHRGDVTWVNVARVGNISEPLHGWWVEVLPDYRAPDNTGLWWAHVAWLAVFAAAAVLAWNVSARLSRGAGVAVVGGLLAAVLVVSLGGCTDDDGEAINPKTSTAASG